MKWSVCIDAVFRGLPLSEAVRRTKGAGIATIEFWGWWNKDLDELESALARNGVTVSTFCTRFTSLTDESVRGEYLKGLEESIPVAKRFGVEQLITQVGSELSGVPRQQQRESVVEGLRSCVPMLQDAGITLLVEPLNTLVDHQGYYLARSSEAFSIVSEVGSEKVKVLYDIYHQQITEGNLIPTITANLPSIGHFHAAGHPGRHELDSGEIDYRHVLEAIEDAGYGGYVGLEYFPLQSQEEGLAAVQKLSSGG